jgi:hypothetical protein
VSSDEPQVQEIQEVRVDVANLYREEVYTDLRVATGAPPGQGITGHRPQYRLRLPRDP